MKKSKPKYGRFQHLVNAQISVNRAVFECNREGYPKGHVLRKKPDANYLVACVKDAIEDLQKYLSEALLNNS